METVRIVDEQDREMAVETRVYIPHPGYANAAGVVTKITDPDADFDDELMRGVEYPPKVSVKFDDGVEDDFTTSLRSTEGDPKNSIYTYVCEDVEVVANAS